jgi:hypothetical protein
LEQASWVAQIVIAVFAVSTAIFAGWQLWEIRREGSRHGNEVKRLADQAKATFLFELDKMFESGPFSRARSGFAVLKKDVDEHVKNHHPHLSITDREETMSEEFSKRLYELRSHNHAHYLRLMSLCGFFETAGVLIEKGYIEEADIEALYGGGIIDLYAATRRHIAQRQEEMRPGYLQWFKRLSERISSNQND